MVYGRNDGGIKMNVDLGLCIVFAFAEIGVFLLGVLGFQILYPKVDEQYDQFIYRINIFSRQNGFVGTVDVLRSDLLKESKI
jgi:hypothetical protein